MEPAVRKFFVALAAIATASAANAADLPQGPVYKAAVAQSDLSWTGLYIGANAGGSWGRRCWTFIDTVPAVGLAGPLNEGCHDPSGAILGGQVGFNWQTGPIVFGLEAQGDWANLRGQNPSLLPSPPFPPSINRTRVDSLGLFTGRIGYAWGPTLIYAKGGAAVVHDRDDFTPTAPPAASTFTGETRWGGTIGGGVEYKFTQNLSGALEYNYVGLGKSRITFPSQPLAAVVDTDKDMHLVTVRLNYSFR
jgi:outer membrane immunogenic protein